MHTLISSSQVPTCSLKAAGKFWPLAWAFLFFSASRQLVLFSVKTIAMCDISTPMLSLNDHGDFLNEEPPCQDQDISARVINPAKLTSLLKDKFGGGSYNVHMMHNVYTIRAPRRLSVTEIAQCA
ncbi:hypothetical protein BDP81DRAFT_429868 [Colletotrichum phormii]|uniref:Uncharacterized protein n=1 Tax=Colletotrichum phormii TaxID=359342 RepID=A0AAI9ZP79_9PEZI|nr:uncharacterized protein BDP81DRAFT_429868 [Colletotrichum phormii]KAK1635548.1 hypothetical protein BDP81DRAFT_429868 [Colletotrichum phormii]